MPITLETKTTLALKALRTLSLTVPRVTLEANAPLGTIRQKMAQISSVKFQKVSRVADHYAMLVKPHHADFSLPSRGRQRSNGIHLPPATTSMVPSAMQILQRNAGKR